MRKKVSGTDERPRMSVCFTRQNIYVQFIDDVARVTLAAASTRAKATARTGTSWRPTRPAPRRLGTLAAADGEGQGHQAGGV